MFEYLIQDKAEHEKRSIEYTTMLIKALYFVATLVMTACIQGTAVQQQTPGSSMQVTNEGHQGHVSQQQGQGQQQQESKSMMPPPPQGPPPPAIRITRQMGGAPVPPPPAAGAMIDEFWWWPGNVGWGWGGYYPAW